MRSEFERYLLKRSKMYLEMKYIFTTKLPYKKEDAQQKQILEDLALLIIKSHLPVHFVESPWLKIFSLQLNPQIFFLSKNIFS